MSLPASPAMTVRKPTIGDKLDAAIREHNVRSFSSPAPWRHPDPHVRLLYRKRQMWAALEAWYYEENPSWERDVAYDDWDEAREKYRDEVTSMWVEFLSRHPAFRPLEQHYTEAGGSTTEVAA